MKLTKVESAALAGYANDVEGMTLEEAKADLAAVTTTIDEETSWQEALTAYVKRLTPAEPTYEAPTYMLTSHESQSRHTRMKWAGALISQLPKAHDGRNSWLLNYGTTDEAMAMRVNRGIEWNETTQAAETRALSNE